MPPPAMLSLVNLKPLRIARNIKRSHLSNLTGIDEKRMRALDLREAEPWFDEALAIHRVMCLPGINPLILSDSLTISDLEKPLPADLDNWRRGNRAPLSLAVRVAIHLGIPDPADLHVSPLIRQLWDIVQSSERHPEAPGWCPWCAADIIGGDPHRSTCLAHNLLHVDNSAGGVTLLTPMTMPRKRAERSKGITAHGLRRARLMADMTQKEVADALGIHQNYYAQVERASLPLTAPVAERLAALWSVEKSTLYARP